MKKSKPLKIRKSIVKQGPIEKEDGGVLAIPTPPEERARSHTEMQAFIKRFKEQNEKP
ncbi:hypothetical protein [Paenibacillus agaridevorans]|uniref:hypothetical protein n=1 Tax=Paenibacillus agaridevorans TaxID=171404 RepID=UPI001BE4CD78|nr:hypothetical protein [Paenibacillus agaridevorans]